MQASLLAACDLAARLMRLTLCLKDDSVQLERHMLIAKHLNAECFQAMQSSGLTERGLQAIAEAVQCTQQEQAFSCNTWFFINWCQGQQHLTSNRENGSLGTGRS